MPFSHFALTVTVSCHVRFGQASQNLHFLVSLLFFDLSEIIFAHQDLLQYMVVV